MDIKKKIETIPDCPGVYFFKDGQGAIIYIGKAGRLRKRIYSHFARRGDSLKKDVMISQIGDIDFNVTASEEEALLCEAGLIKKYKPKFNVVYRDDKAYPFLKLTSAEEYPRLFITRKRKNDDALYFGPFTGAKLLKKALILMKRIFPLRTCRSMPKSACLNYHLKQCLAPCLNRENKSAYNQLVKDVILFLQGERRQLITILDERMVKASVAQDYEEAAKIRDQIKALISLTTPPSDKKAALEDLKELLGLRVFPRKVEAFDVSNYSGREAVGALVAFLDGEPHKVNYRRFKIKFEEGPDDYAMMKEMIKRHFQRLIEEKQGYPDLVVIDGGQGHLSVISGELKEMGLGSICIAALAKEHEFLYLKDRPQPIDLFKFPRILFLMQRIRDEAHRFAVSYHHKLRAKILRSSLLDNVPGIGEERKRLLLSHFGSVNKIRHASLSELCKISTIDEKMAARIREYLK